MNSRVPTRAAMIGDAFTQVYDVCRVDGHCADRRETAWERVGAACLLRDLGATDEELRNEAYKFVRESEMRAVAHRDGAAMMRAKHYGEEAAVPLDLAADHCDCVAATVRACFNL